MEILRRYGRVAALFLLLSGFFEKKQDNEYSLSYTSAYKAAEKEGVYGYKDVSKES